MSSQCLCLCLCLWVSVCLCVFFYVLATSLFLFTSGLTKLLEISTPPKKRLSSRRIVRLTVECALYQRKVDVDMLNAARSFDEGLKLETSANTLSTAFSTSTSTLHRYIVRFTATPTQTKTSSHRDWYPK